jgi:hypothetical protein
MQEKNGPIELDMSEGTDGTCINITRGAGGKLLGVRIHVRTEAGEHFATELLPLAPAVAKPGTEPES